MLKDYEALILAGGKSSRFGRDKTLEPFLDSSSLTHHLYNKLCAVFGSVKIASKTQKFNPPLPLLKDDFSEFAPIFVLSNLDKFYKKEVFIIPADMPNVSKNSIFTLFSALENHDVSYAKTKIKEHFLCGFFKPQIAQIARAQIAQNELAIYKLLEHCNCAISSFDDNLEFSNINTQDDLKILEF